MNQTPVFGFFGNRSESVGLVVALGSDRISLASLEWLISG
jgi:hypothetical protein